MDDVNTDTPGPDSQGEPELPRGVALAWGVVANPQRGPKRELSAERIVEVAAELADEGGLAAVSMSAVAARLGFTTMSLYRYVTAKEDLLLLLGEYGVGVPPARIVEAPDWREGLRRWHAAVTEVYAARPWLLDLPVDGAPITPNSLAWLESALTILSRTPLALGDRLSAAILLSGQARWEGIVSRGYTDIAGAGGSREERGRLEAFVYGSLAGPDFFPVLAATVAGADLDDEQETFRFGLERILDGLELQMRRASGDAPPPSPPAPDESSYPRDEAVRKARQVRREAEKSLREAVKREKEVVAKAREREAKDREREARERERQARSRG